MSDTDNPKKKSEGNEMPDEEQPPKILQEMDKRLQNLEQGQAEMRETLRKLWKLQRLEERSPELKKKVPRFYERDNYPSVSTFGIWQSYWNNCFIEALDEFCENHPFLLWKFSISERSNTLYGDLIELWKSHVQYYTGKFRDRYLDAVCDYDRKPSLSYRDHIHTPYVSVWVNFNEKKFKDFVKTGKLNSEQAEEKRNRAFQRINFLNGCIQEGEISMKALCRHGMDDKAFWMEGKLSNFFQVVKKHIEKKVKGTQFTLETTEEGNKMVEQARDNWGEVFVEFEKDLRSVQRDVEEYWEASKYLWEKWWVVVPLAVGGGLSVFAANIAICEWLRKSQWFQWFGGCAVNEWGVWFLPGVGLLAAGYFVYKMIKRRKNRW